MCACADWRCGCLSLLPVPASLPIVMAPRTVCHVGVPELRLCTAAAGGCGSRIDMTHVRHNTTPTCTRTCSTILAGAPAEQLCLRCPACSVQCPFHCGVWFAFCCVAGRLPVPTRAFVSCIFTVRALYRLPWQDAAVHPPVVCLCLQSPCCAVSSKCIEGVWRMSTAFVDHLTCCSRVHVCSACMLACVGAGRVCAYIPATPLLLCFLVPCGGAVCRICAVFCWRNLLLRPPGYVKYCSCAARWAAVAADSFLPHLCIHSLHEIWHVRAGMSGRPPELVQL